MTKILITGAAGFIGFHLAKRLAREGGEDVFCLDNINDYYDPFLKRARLKNLGFDVERDLSAAQTSALYPNLRFLRADLFDKELVLELFRQESFDHVVHLAAQAGVRFSLQSPHSYVDNNVSAFVNILEACRAYPVEHLLFASSSSVYGLNAKIPFSESENVDFPASLYAATKRADELMAHTYSHLFDIACTGLRFFTVYGPWGRPDMACFLFTKKIYAEEAIDIYNYGDMYRDFTYIDDIVEGICLLIPHIPVPIADPLTNSNARYGIFNIGHNKPVALLDFVETLERAIGMAARKNMLPMQLGDVQRTYADIEKINRAVGFSPKTSTDSGLREFVNWYRAYYKK